MDCSSGIAILRSRYHERQNKVPHDCRRYGEQHSFASKWYYPKTTTSDMYMTLKSHLIDQFADSEQKRIKKLLHDLELGDTRPSHLLREMRYLAGSQMNESMLKSICMNRLPPNIRSIISIVNDSLDKVALLADKIIEVNDVPMLNALTTRDFHTSQTPLKRQLAEITKEIATLKASIYQRSTSRDRRQHRLRSRKFSSNSDNDICWFHQKFGDDARKCQKPCKNL